ncbi:MAG: monovalent cation/H(+) antiporter subunit G [Palaeococcus sp.]|uniref:monovalent cation/H(+) antiporter subunit G n=1 Tax=Palaeococcus sp. (in: euryarchaeotes) TaxID=2820298 RepID=UPI000F1B07F2|nr:monovalent cation/H(+) antiporter subunit G [Palaeococcus sp. (in: euryarchaeotes)]MCD6559212.1 monovalent cation/H(+) antiporter subunit G [Palaeococcus sp. (in: euryarchaeotes)]RLF75452.1 MAG: cation:proton antiporter [Thermococci archaeon]
MGVIEYMIYTFLAINMIFNLLGSISLHRFPDVYTRLHGATKCTTFGTIFAVLAVVVHALYQLRITNDPKYLQMALHSVVALIALLLTNPTGAHAIAKAAHLSGVKPVKAVIDAYERKLEEGAQ